MEENLTAAAVREHYCQVGDKEWTRLSADVAGRVSLEVHRRFLHRFVSQGSRVLEIGAGPGRFTLELAALGCRIVVTDISSVQLGLNAVGSRPGTCQLFRHTDVERLSSRQAESWSAQPPATGPRCRIRSRWFGWKRYRSVAPPS